MRRHISPKRLELPESSNSLKLKKYIIYLALLIPIVGNAQFEISYDENTNTMSVNYTGCEICLLGGSPTALSACQCHNDCEEIEPTDEQLKRYEECISDCDENHEDGSFVHDACLDGCEKYLEGIKDECWSSCGEEPKPVLTIIGYTYSLVAAWAPIDNDPKDDMSRWSRRPFTPVIVGDWVDIPDWNPPSPWPGIYAGNNRCWAIAITIFYEDSEGNIFFCNFSQWECEFVG